MPAARQAAAREGRGGEDERAGRGRWATHLLRRHNGDGVLGRYRYVVRAGVLFSLHRASELPGALAGAHLGTWMCGAETRVPPQTAGGARPTFIVERRRGLRRSQKAVVVRTAGGGARYRGLEAGCGLRAWWVAASRSAWRVHKGCRCSADALRGASKEPKKEVRRGHSPRVSTAPAHRIHQFTPCAPIAALADRFSHAASGQSLVPHLPSARHSSTRAPCAACGVQLRRKTAHSTALSSLLSHRLTPMHPCVE